jgi:parvulin-like peptidyl-prolyl isomerase
MTLRSSNSTRPARRRSRRDDTRRAVIVSIMFIAAIVVSLSLVGGVFASSYYSSHQAAVSSVNGEGISKDAVRDRVALKVARDKQLIQDYLILRNKGLITPDEYATLASTPSSDQTATTLYSDALTALQTEGELRQYAAKNGITISDQAVAEQKTKDSTIAEMRHVRVISIVPYPFPPANGPAASDMTAAQSRAQAFHDEISGGKSWTDVTVEVKKIRGGAESDDGLLTSDYTQLEPDLMAAVYGLAKVNDVTPVFKGADGVFRFATVTSIVPAYADAGWEKAMAGDYGNYVHGLAVRAAVKAAIEKQYIDSPTVQRRVSELAVSAGYGSAGGGDDVKISFVVFAPNHSTANASSVDAADPAWAEAKSRAEAAVATLRADPSKFDSMARDTTVNDDTAWNSAGGSIPWIPSDLFNVQTQGGYNGLGMTNVQAAVLVPGLVANTILDPIQETTQGWVVVKFEGRRPSPAQRIADAQLRLALGSDFVSEVRAESEAGDAAEDGDMGWISPFQLVDSEMKAIFVTPVGGVSYMVNEGGFFVYKVMDEQTRTPDAKQAARLRNVVFNHWLTELTANTNIWTDSAGLTAINPSST